MAKPKHTIEIEDNAAPEWQPELRLLQAFLQRMILDVIGQDAQLRREAREWFNDGGFLPFSFLWVCQHLSICEKEIRFRIRNQFKVSL